MELNVEGQKPAQKMSITSTERRWLLHILDLIAINGGFLLSIAYRADYQLSWGLIVQRPEWFVLLNGLWFILGNLLQVYDIERAGRPRSAYLPVLYTGLATTTVFNFIPYLTPTLPESRQPLFIAILLPVCLLMVGRLIYLMVFARARFRRKVLILGAGWAGKTIFEVLTEHGETLYDVVGFVDDDPQKLGEIIKERPEDPESGSLQPASAKVLGSSAELIQLTEEYGVSTIVLAITRNVHGPLYQVLTDCLQREIEVIPMPLLYEEMTGKVPVEHIGDHWSVSMPLEQPGTRLAWHAVKRLFDLFWASLGLVVLAILFPFIAAAIRLDSPGPILYTQKRMGRNGKVFQVYKFRSMRVDAEKNQAVWAQKNDPRVTRVGKFLRKTHIDEFPQFWNILKGEMSVVGPRPERPEFVSELAREIPFYRVRLAVKPGMAGWGLIHQGYGASKKDALEKLQFDLYYIKHQSFWLDLFVLWRTVLDAITLGGR